MSFPRRRESSFISRSNFLDSRLRGNDTIKIIMKILVTGAKGQLGKKIIEILGSRHELFLTDSDNMDITDFDIVKKVVEENKPDYIIHAAAYTQVDKAEENIDLCRKINSLGTKNVATVARENDIKLIYISTDFVFDGSKKSPYQETDEAKPLSVYGLTKYEGEKFIQEICEKYYIIRVAWLFGELPDNHPGTNFVEVMLRIAREKGTVSVVNDQIGSPTYTGDLVEVMAKLVEQNPEYGIYHFSGVGECSWYDFAKEIFAQTSTAVNLLPITSEQYPQKAKRPPYSYLDKTKIENSLKIKVRPWQEMLGEYLSGKGD
jgi:dTDP-4-dehydrorhamnose reductase